MSSPRFVIEGEWSGYRSSQQKVVHRSVHAGSEKKLRAWAEKAYAITYTDGTTLRISVRDCAPRERVKQQLGYMTLIRDCAYHNVSSIDALISAKNALRAARRATFEATGA